MNKSDSYLSPGTKIRYDGGPVPEFGVVVHCWFDQDIHAYDCYVAFFGDQFPEAKPAHLPYVLRYASMFLAVIDPASSS